MDFILMVFLLMVVMFVLGFIVGEASCMNLYTEELAKQQRAFEKKLEKLIRR